MSKFFDVMANQKSQNTGKHLKSLMDAVAALRGNVASVRQSVGLTRVMCLPEGLSSLTKKLDAFDDDLRAVLDDLAAGVADTTISITEISTAPSNGAAPTLQAVLGKEKPKGSDGEAAAPSGGVSSLKAKLQGMKGGSNSGDDTTGGSLSGPTSSN